VTGDDALGSTAPGSWGECDDAETQWLFVGDGSAARTRRGLRYSLQASWARWGLSRAASSTGTPFRSNSGANGFDFFIVVSGNADVRSATLNAPGSYQSTTTGFATVSGQTAFGAATTGTYTPGQTIRIMRYGATALTKTFQGEKPEELSVYDAREVLRYLGRESPVTHSGETPGLKK